MKNAITWFEIPTTQLDRAQAFYEAVLGQTMRREAMGPSEGAVFAYDPEADGTGGALLMGPTAPQPAPGAGLPGCFTLARRCPGPRAGPGRPGGPASPGAATGPGLLRAHP